LSHWRICIVSTSRADYGCLHGLIREVHADPDLELQLVVMGTHWASESRRRQDRLTDEGVPVALVVDADPTDDSPGAIGEANGRAMQQFALALPRLSPHVVVVLGDRFELMAPALAALLNNIPLAHLHGGELSLGAIDDSVRHALTKLAKLHFVATARYATRVVQMGEPMENVFTVGAPALDGIRMQALPDRDQLAADLGISFDNPVALVTYHPVTREPGTARAQITAVLTALKGSGLSAVLTTANADAAGQEINAELQRFVTGDAQRFVLFEHLGRRRYFGCLMHCAVMIGNSSSGLIEAPSFSLPVVNIGDRQQGRIRAENVIDVECDPQEILGAIGKALQPQFRTRLRSMVNPYDADGDGRASVRIKDILKSQLADGLTARKRFRDSDEGRAKP
jgi:UDP-hydrolysing UDP-N-acetyl-D-glucosamine 2-epimerase